MTDTATRVREIIAKELGIGIAEIEREVALPTVEPAARFVDDEVAEAA